jgi:tRNA-intron endonuclease
VHHFKTCPSNKFLVKGSVDGTSVRLGMDGLVLYEQSGYGRPEKDGLRLAPQEALYLVYRSKIIVEGYDLKSLISYFSEQELFFRSFIVYRDLRERGYVVQTGPHDFRVFRRGQRPGVGTSQYMVRVLSERDLIDFEVLISEAAASINMRKQHVLAVVDDEGELTYYEIKLQPLQKDQPEPTLEPVEGLLTGRSVLIPGEAGSAFEAAGYGKRFDDQRLMLSLVEAGYLQKRGILTVYHGDQILSAGKYTELFKADDAEATEKAAVYDQIRDLGYIPRTGYKFGHHFRVYVCGMSHSDLLIHAIARGTALPMSVISRSVRLAHSVKKKMLFGCVHTTGIQYIEFGRIKL